MADYLKMPLNRTGYRYILMLVCRFLCFVLFIPTVTTNAVDVARSIIQWESLMGLPAWLISDRGSYSKNDLLCELTDLMGIKHHITLSYCPCLGKRVCGGGRKGPSVDLKVHLQ